MKTLYTKDTNKRKRPDSDVGDRGGGTTDCAELGAQGYEVEQQDVVDDSGGVFEPVFKVRQPLSTYAPR
jgi:hypothetical protein